METPEIIEENPSASAVDGDVGGVLVLAYQPPIGVSLEPKGLNRGVARLAEQNPR